MKHGDGKYGGVGFYVHRKQDVRLGPEVAFGSPCCDI